LGGGAGRRVHAGGAFNVGFVDALLAILKERGALPPAEPQGFVR